jgi:hypothetical protein
VAISRSDGEKCDEHQELKKSNGFVNYKIAQSFWTTFTFMLSSLLRGLRQFTL